MRQNKRFIKWFLSVGNFTFYFSLWRLCVQPPVGGFFAKLCWVIFVSTTLTLAPLPQQNSHNAAYVGRASVRQIHPCCVSPAGSQVDCVFYTVASNWTVLIRRAASSDVWWRIASTRRISPASSTRRSPNALFTVTALRSVHAHKKTDIVSRGTWRCDRYCVQEKPS